MMDIVSSIILLILLMVIINDIFSIVKSTKEIRKMTEKINDMSCNRWLLRMGMHEQAEYFDSYVDIDPWRE